MYNVTDLQTYRLTTLHECMILHIKLCVDIWIIYSLYIPYAIWNLNTSNVDHEKFKIGIGQWKKNKVMIKA